MLNHEDTLTRCEKNKVNFVFLSCLFVPLPRMAKVLSLAVKNNQASLIFLARLFVPLSCV